MNIKNVNNNQKKVSQKIKQKNNENRSIVISSSFSKTQIFFFQNHRNDKQQHIENITTQR